MSGLEGLEGLAHSPGTDSEHEALTKIAPHRTPMKLRILEALAMAGAEGLIPEEYPGLINTVRRRFTELWVAGLIRPNGIYRKNARGNKVGIWVLGADQNRIRYAKCQHCHGKGKIVRL